MASSNPDPNPAGSSSDQHSIGDNNEEVGEKVCLELSLARLTLPDELTLTFFHLVWTAGLHHQRACEDSQNEENAAGVQWGEH